MIAEIDPSQASGWAFLIILPILFLCILAILLPLFVWRISIRARELDFKLTRTNQLLRQLIKGSGQEPEA
jgi:hypothetical protein